MSDKFYMSFWTDWTSTRWNLSYQLKLFNQYLNLFLEVGTLDTRQSGPAPFDLHTPFLHIFPLFPLIRFMAPGVLFEDQWWSTDCWRERPHKYVCLSLHVPVCLWDIWTQAHPYTSIYFKKSFLLDGLVMFWTETLSGTKQTKDCNYKERANELWRACVLLPATIRKQKSG